MNEVILLAVAFFAAATLYASVGHAGASGSSSWCRPGATIHPRAVEEHQRRQRAVTRSLVADAQPPWTSTCSMAIFVPPAWTDEDPGG
jgi:hypothetical protein